jgi:hypothetical protein
MDVCCVLSGRGQCDDPSTRPEESYRLRCAAVCDLDTSPIAGPGPLGLPLQNPTNRHYFNLLCLYIGYVLNNLTNTVLLQRILITSVRSAIYRRCPQTASSAANQNLNILPQCHRQFSLLIFF